MAITLVSKRNSSRAKSDPLQLGQVKGRISALIRSLRSFDVTTIDHRNDWKANAFADLINTTLADIFGQNSQEYEKYSIRSFDTLPSVPGIEYPLPEVRQGYQKGIAAAAQKLHLLLDVLEKESGTAEEAPTPVPQGAATTANWINEKVSLITMRANLRNRHVPPVTIDPTTPADRKAVKAGPEVGIAREGMTDAESHEPQPKEDVVGAKSRGGEGTFGRKRKEGNQRKVDKADLAGVGQKHEPVAAGQEEGRSPEYTEATWEASGPEGFEKGESAQDEPGTPAIKADKEAPVDVRADAIAADHPDGATIESELQEADSRPPDQMEFLSPEFLCQEPWLGSLADKPRDDGSEKEASLPSADQAIFLGNDELPITFVAATVTEESHHFSIAPEGHDAGVDKQPLAEIVAEPRDEVTHTDAVAEGPAEPRVTLALLPDIDLVPEMRPWEAAVNEVDHEVAPIGTWPEEPVEPRAVVTPDVDVTPEMLVPEPEVEDGQDTTPSAADVGPAVSVSINPFDKPSTALKSPSPFRMARLVLPAGEEHGIQVAGSSVHPDEAGTADIETDVSEPGEREAAGGVSSEPSQEQSPTLKHGPFATAATERVIESPCDDVLPRKLSSVEQWAGGPERSSLRIGPEAVEDELPATCLEKAAKPKSAGSSDPGNIEHPTRTFTKKMEGPPEPKVADAPKGDLSVDTAPNPAGTGQDSEEVPPGPAEDLVETVTEPAPKVEQNPFAVKDHGKTQPQPLATAAELQAQIGALTERIEDLRNFDVATITQRYDPKVQALCDSVNNTIADIFGRNTPAYWYHSLPSFEAGHTVLGSPKRSPAALRGVYREEIEKAVKALVEIGESLKIKLDKLQKEPISENRLVTEPAPDHGKGAMNEENAMVVGQPERPRPRKKPQLEVKEPAKREAIEKPIEKVAPKAPKVEQNPFAVKDHGKTQPQPLATAAELQAQIGALTERIEDLRNFDVATITQRYDPKVQALCDSVNNTIADIFGRNTPAYWYHSLPSFEAGHTVLGSPKRSPAVLRGVYREEIEKAVKALVEIGESLKIKLEQSESHDSP